MMWEQEVIKIGKSRSSNPGIFGAMDLGFGFWILLDLPGTAGVLLGIPVNCLRIGTSPWKKG